MKSILVLAGVMAMGIASVGAAATLQCKDETSGYAMTATFPGRPGMGSTRGTGTLTLDGQDMGKLGCVYTSGITVSLNCKNSDYQVSGVANLKTLRLFYQNQQIGTLTCK